MRLRSLIQRGVITRTALIGLAVVGCFTTADAGVVRQAPGATSAQIVVTDFSAARKQRQTRRPPVRSNADSIPSQPPARPSFGYGIGDNSTYGGG